LFSNPVAITEETRVREVWGSLELLFPESAPVPVAVEVAFEALPVAADVEVVVEALSVAVDVRVAFEVDVELALEMLPAAVDVELAATTLFPLLPFCTLFLFLLLPTFGLLPNPRFS
jgi:hypothetical protein